MKRTRVLVVDDSAAMRGLIIASLRSDPLVEVVGQVGDALAARQAIKSLNPDVITLDIEMPKMNGLEFLEKIMRLRPMPVIMISSLTSGGADATIRALEIGAVDCVVKPSITNPGSFDDLPAKVKMASGLLSRSEPRPGHIASDLPSDSRGIPFAPDGRIVAIGASTGGVEALIAILSQFPVNCPPTVVVQHMPAMFTTSLAQRLNRLCRPGVGEAIDGAPLKVGQVYLAPGSIAHLEIVGTQQPRCRLHSTGPVGGHQPCIDNLFTSLAKSAGSKSVGVILTGMGKDGASGLLAMRQAGARTLGQNEATCVVYGMPKAAFQIGAVEQQVPLAAMAAEILAPRPTAYQHKSTHHAIC